MAEETKYREALGRIVHETTKPNGVTTNDWYRETVTVARGIAERALNGASDADRIDEQMQRAGGAPDECVTREPGSTDGSWVLTMAVIEPGNTATIPIVQLPDGSTEPESYEGEKTLTFVWASGRRVVWSWTNLLRAEYTPPVRGTPPGRAADPVRAAAIAACPTPVYHETHRYCPSCPWTEADG